MRGESPNSSCSESDTSKFPEFTVNAFAGCGDSAESATPRVTFTQAHVPALMKVLVKEPGVAPRGVVKLLASYHTTGS